MPQEELDLFQFPAGRPAEPRTRPAEVVWREVADARLCGEFLNDVPCKLLGDALSPRLTGATDATKNASRFDFCSFYPPPEFAMDPVWNWDRPDVTAFAAQVYDRPMSLALLEMINGQLGYFVTPQATRKQER